MANKELKLPNTKYAVVNISDTVGDNTNSLQPLAWFTTAYADKIIDAVDFGGGGGTGGGDVTREQFNNEVQARKDGDATLTTNLNKEIQDRENADTTLQGNIDNEVQARTDRDSTLTTNLNKEIQDRKKADSTLQNNIDEEVSARTTDIEHVNSSIATERGARISADNEINQKLTQEKRELTRKIDNNTSQITSLQEMLSVYWQAIYPVGSIYVSTSATFNPQTTWGGTWVKTAKGRCLIGANDTYPLGSTGGEEKHTLTVDEMPKHRHTVDINNGIQTGNEGQTSYWGHMGPARFNTDFVGKSLAHNNMQPYLAVYIWERTA